ncbi:hypothetical protein OsI_23618 [Oryza sativa Indica Group]|uniref:Uncharacterized protein n=2 Tax=Oryza sativa TaxID=4530 RepID=A3BDC9_ORYSJ|nr:hypothetical protein OsI_23618 [Oryza sativa Indica Group]EAZ37568.1 hypothetical protein OsJ_21899 [Oryza sativa Japonica Group]
MAITFSRFDNAAAAGGMRHDLTQTVALPCAWPSTTIEAYKKTPNVELQDQVSGVNMLLG